MTVRSTDPFHRSVYLTGPTASGKTAIGVELALRLEAEVICLDSMTLYRGMDIGTAKPTVAERRGVPHHLIDVIDPSRNASVAEYRALAAEKIAEIESRGKIPIFIGGTPLYLKALLRGLFEGPSADPALRESLAREALEQGAEALHARLDPETAARLHKNDVRRIIRALEVQTLTGESISKRQVEHETPAPASVRVFALSRPRRELYDRINARVDAMFESGLIDEAKALLNRAEPIASAPAQAVGYREVFDYLEGRITLAEAIERTKTRTRRFAKRQETWFRSLEEIEPVPVAGEPPEITAERIIQNIYDMS